MLLRYLTRLSYFFIVIAVITGIIFCFIINDDSICRIGKKRFTHKLSIPSRNLYQVMDLSPNLYHHAQIKVTLFSLRFFASLCHCLLDNFVCLLYFSGACFLVITWIPIVRKESMMKSLIYLNWLYRWKGGFHIYYIALKSCHVTVKSIAIVQWNYKMGSKVLLAFPLWFYWIFLTLQIANRLTMK